MEKIRKGWYLMVRRDTMDNDSCIVTARKPWLDCVRVKENGDFCYNMFGEWEESNISEWPEGTFRKIEVPADLAELE